MLETQVLYKQASLLSQVYFQTHPTNLKLLGRGEALLKVHSVEHVYLHAMLHTG